MFVKILGSILIIFSTSIIGYILAHRYTERIQQLKNIYLSFQILETEIIYLSNSLPIAMQRVGNKSNPIVKNIFTDTHQMLSKKAGYSMEEAWNKSIHNNFSNTSLIKEDCEILIDFGKNLGSTDKENQVKNFKFIYLQLEKQQKDAETLKIKNEKMYKSLGALVGIAIVILLI